MGHKYATFLLRKLVGMNKYWLHPRAVRGEQERGVPLGRASSRIAYDSIARHGHIDMPLHIADRYVIVTL